MEKYAWLNMQYRPMMHIKRLVGILVLAGTIFLFESRIVFASLVEVDFANPGDALLTRDTSTDLEWLDVTATTNRTYTNVVNGSDDYSYGGGWRHASTSEVDALFREAGWGGCCAGNQTNHYAPALLLVSLFGVTYTNAGNEYVQGITHVSGDFSRVSRAVKNADGTTGEIGIATTGIWATNPSVSHGHFLVRNAPTPPTPTPVPSAVALFPIGLAFMEWHRRRKAVHH